MEKLIANLAGATRRERLGGREYLVAPLTMIVPGVLNGSKGALYYPDDEIAKSPSAWNHMPIVAYHPVENGVHVSARHPAVLDKQGIGYVFGAKAEGKLTAEGWFDVERTEAVDNRILQALEEGRQLELSTGLFTDNELAEEGATHNGKTYEYVARNYRPDHLAILPDQIGACSVKDGCGVLVNTDVSELIRKELSLMDKKKTIDFLIENCSCWETGDREMLEGLSDEKLGALKANTEKILQEQAVANAARKGFEDDNVSFTWNEEKGEFDAKVKPPKAKEGEETPPVANKKEEPKPKTTEEYLKELPVEIQTVVNRSLAKEKAERDKLVEAITANKRNKLTKDQLNRMDTEQLEAIAALAVEVKPNYTGAAAPAANAREDDDDVNDVLPLPTINWEEVSK